MTRPVSTQRPATTTRLTVAENGARSIVDKAVAKWRQGGKADAIRVLHDHPEVAADQSLVLDLALEEYCLRRERGDQLGPRTFRERFESFGAVVAASVERQVEIEDLVDRQHLGRETLEWPNIDDLVEGFRVSEELGRGGLARVYLCREESIGDRKVVVKLCAGHTSEPHWLGRLSHPNIVPILSSRSLPEKHGALVCMPYLGKCTLNDLIVEADVAGGGSDGPAYLERVLEAESPSAEEVLRWGELDPYRVLLRLHKDIAAALAHAHQKGVIHGDVKPTNILATAAGGLLIDFNLAFGCGLEETCLGGTLPYLAPERVEAMLRRDRSPAVSASPGLDSFAFGITLADSLLSSRQIAVTTLTVSDADDAEKLYASQVSHVNAALRQLPVGSLLLSALSACVSRDPAARPTAGDLREAIESEDRRLVHRRQRAVLTRRAVGAVVATSFLSFLVRRATAGPTVPERYRRGKELLQGAQHEEAAGEFDEILRLEPEHFGARYSRAWAQIGVADISAAVRDLRVIVRRGSDDYAAASIGYCRAIGLQYSAGAAWYECVTGETREDVGVLNNCACCYWKGRTSATQTGQIALARSMFARAGTLDLSSAIPLLNRVLMEISLFRKGVNGSDPETGRSVANELLLRTSRDEAKLAAICLHAMIDLSGTDGERRSLELLNELVSKRVGPNLLQWEQDIAYRLLREDEQLDRRVRSVSRRVELPPLQLLPHPPVHPQRG